MENFSKDNTAH